MICALLLSTLITAQIPDGDNSGAYGGPVFFSTTTTGYDYKAEAKYTRTIYVWIMPAEYAPGTEYVPQQLRSVRINVSLQSVPAVEGALCDPNAIVTYDEGVDWIQGCLHGQDQEPTPINHAVSK